MQVSNMLGKTMPSFSTPRKCKDSPTIFAAVGESIGPANATRVVSNYRMRPILQLAHLGMIIAQLQTVPRIIMRQSI